MSLDYEDYVSPVANEKHVAINAILNHPMLAAGGTVSASSIRRWMESGVRRRFGEKVILEFVWVRGQRFTSYEAIERFFVALNAPPTKQEEARRRIRYAKQSATMKSIAQEKRALTPPSP